MAERPAPVGIYSQWPLARVSHQSRLSTNDEMKAGDVHRFTVTYLTTKENRGKPQLGDRLIKVCQYDYTAHQGWGRKEVTT